MNCEIFVCKKCIVKLFYKDYLFFDMRELYECYFEICRSEILKIWEYLILMFNNIVCDVGEDVINIKDMFENIRSVLKFEVDVFKIFVDDVVFGEIDKFGKIEKDIIENFNNEEDILIDFILYLINFR